MHRKNGENRDARAALSAAGRTKGGGELHKMPFGTKKGLALATADCARFATSHKRPLAIKYSVGGGGMYMTAATGV